MKTLLSAFCLIGLGLSDLVCGAVTVADITKAQFDSYITTYDVSFSVVFRGGGDSGFGSEEIQVAQSTAFPDTGGSSTTTIGNLPSDSGVRWGQPVSDIQVDLSNLGYISARALSTVITPTWGVVRSTSQILILTADRGFFGGSQLSSNTIAGTSVRNLFADSFGSYQYDAVSVSGFDANTFTYNANWAPGTSPGASEQYVMIVGINNPSMTIPEVSTSLLFFSTTLLMFLRKRR